VTPRALEVKDVSAAACCAPIGHRVMSETQARATASLFKALADPGRVRILNLLAVSMEPVCVCNLTELLGVGQPTVSFHMKKLMDAGLLDREQRGIWAFYSLREDARRRLNEVLNFEVETVV
jgi:ArsR family transcriptional regulator